VILGEISALVMARSFRSDSLGLQGPAHIDNQITHLSGEDQRQHGQKEMLIGRPLRRPDLYEKNELRGRAAACRPGVRADSSSWHTVVLLELPRR
jgi:hypothetical protein